MGIVMKQKKDNRFYKFFIPSLIGAILFVVPINQKGNFQREGDLVLDPYDGISLCEYDLFWLWTGFHHRRAYRRTGG